MSLSLLRSLSNVLVLCRKYSFGDIAFSRIRDVFYVLCNELSFSPKHGVFLRRELRVGQIHHYGVGIQVGSDYFWDMLVFEFSFLCLSSSLAVCSVALTLCLWVIRHGYIGDLINLVLVIFGHAVQQYYNVSILTVLSVCPTQRWLDPLSPYSPDVSPCDFLFIRLKRLADINKVNRNFSVALNGIKKDGPEISFQ